MLPLPQILLVGASLAYRKTLANADIKETPG
jgi:hypothetical protein